MAVHLAQAVVLASVLVMLLIVALVALDEGRRR
jgi:hypothetical protein